MVGLQFKVPVTVYDLAPPGEVEVVVNSLVENWLFPILIGHCWDWISTSRCTSTCTLLVECQLTSFMMSGDVIIGVPGGAAIIGKEFTTGYSGKIEILLLDSTDLNEN
jgi:hypothetical protein